MSGGFVWLFGVLTWIGIQVEFQQERPISKGPSKTAHVPQHPKHPTPIAPGESSRPPTPTAPRPAVNPEPFRNDRSCGTMFKDMPPCKVVEKWFGCQTEDDVDRISSYLLRGERELFGDQLAMAVMLGQCTILEVGDLAYREDLKFFNQTIQFRRPGEATSYWTHQTAFWPPAEDAT